MAMSTGSFDPYRYEVQINIRDWLLLLAIQIFIAWVIFG